MLIGADRPEGVTVSAPAPARPALVIVSVAVPVAAKLTAVPGVGDEL
jgi:hypothetical protein